MLCHPDRSRGTCAPTDPSWECFSPRGISLGAKRLFRGREQYAKGYTFSLHEPEEGGLGGIHNQGSNAKPRVVAHEVKALEHSVFGPCTPRRTWGSRPEPLTVVAKPGTFGGCFGG